MEVVASHPLTAVAGLQVDVLQPTVVDLPHLVAVADLPHLVAVAEVLHLQVGVVEVVVANLPSLRVAVADLPHLQVVVAELLVGHQVVVVDSLAVQYAVPFAMPHAEDLVQLVENLEVRAAHNNLAAIHKKLKIKVAFHAVIHVTQPLAYQLVVELVVLHAAIHVIGILMGYHHVVLHRAGC